MFWAFPHLHHQGLHCSWRRKIVSFAKVKVNFLFYMYVKLNFRFTYMWEKHFFSTYRKMNFTFVSIDSSALPEIPLDAAAPFQIPPFSQTTFPSILNDVRNMIYQVQMAQNILKIHGYEEILRDRLDLNRAVERTLVVVLSTGLHVSLIFCSNSMRLLNLFSSKFWY